MNSNCGYDRNLLMTTTTAAVTTAKRDSKMVIRKTKKKRFWLLKTLQWHIISSIAREKMKRTLVLVRPKWGNVWVPDQKVSVQLLIQFKNIFFFRFWPLIRRTHNRPMDWVRLGNKKMHSNIHIIEVALFSFRRVTTTNPINSIYSTSKMLKTRAKTIKSFNRSVSALNWLGMK